MGAEQWSLQNYACMDLQNIFSSGLIDFSSFIAVYKDCCNFTVQNNKDNGNSNNAGFFALS